MWMVIVSFRITNSNKSLRLRLVAAHCQDDIVQYDVVQYDVVTVATLPNIAVVLYASI